VSFWVAVISAKKHKRQRRERQSVTAKREKSQTPKFFTAILTLPGGAFDGAKNHKRQRRKRQTRKFANAKVRIG